MKIGEKCFLKIPEEDFRKLKKNEQEWIKPLLNTIVTIDFIGKEAGKLVGIEEDDGVIYYNIEWLVPAIGVYEKELENFIK